MNQSYYDTQKFYEEVKRTLHEEFDSLGCTFKDEPYHVKSHMYTITPRLLVYTKNGRCLGEVCFDKDQCSPARYFSMYTGVTGGSTSWDAQRVRKIFRLMYNITRPEVTNEQILEEGAALQLREGAVKYFTEENVRKHYIEKAVDAKSS